MRFKFLAAALFVIFVSGVYAAEPAVILKNQKVTVNRDKIYLGDVADFSGVGSDEADDLSTIYIKRAALPGYSVSITRVNVENQVKKDFRNMKISGPESVDVYTEKTEVTRDSLVETAVKYIYENMPWKSEDVSITAKAGRENTPVINGNVLLKVREDNKVSYRGNVLVPVEITVDGKFYKLAPVSLLIRVSADCLVAADVIRARETLDGRMRVEKKDITYFPGKILTDAAKTAGKTAKRTIAQGTVLTEDMFETAPLVRRGGTVSVVVKIRGISVETSGTSFSEAREGEIVKVKLATGKILDGRVSPDGKVIIER